MKTVLTAKEHAAIKEAAALLPKVQRHIRRAMKGTELLELGYTEWDRQPIDPSLTYAVDKILEANMVVVLTRICENEGAELLHFAVDRMQNGRMHLAKDGTIEFVNTNVLRRA